MEITTSYSTESIQLFECFNKVKNTYIVRFDETKIDNGYKYQQYLTDGKPDLESIKEIVLDYYSKLCDQEIINGFTFEGNQVWLTAENQFNYKAAADLAYQTNGASLPTTFKFGPTGTPVYRVFKEVEDLQNFHVKFISYIDTTLKKYWEIKDNIDWNKYELE